MLQMAKLQQMTVFDGRHFVRHLLICNRICVKLLQLMRSVSMHNLVKKVSVLKMVELQPIITLHGSHLVRDLGICNRICINHVQLMCAVITRKIR